MSKSKKAHHFWTWISILNVVMGICAVTWWSVFKSDNFRTGGLFMFIFGLSCGIGMNRLAPSPPLKGLRDE